AASEDWGQDGLASRIARAGRELARFMAGSGQGAGPVQAPDTDTAAAIAPRSLTGAITSVDPDSGFDVVPFAQQLAALRVE
ncbi:hydroxymethylpyrimidine ABC transporter substrate-binding protein, partial [Streptomyces sp. NPDC017988]